MALGPSGRRNEPLNVVATALALALAAAIGAAAGLIWHASGLGGDDQATAAAKQPADAGS